MLATQSDKVEEAINGVQTMKVDDGSQEEVKQPRVTKAQKRRVSYWFLLSVLGIVCVFVSY